VRATISDLAALSGGVLDALSVASASGRVRERPDVRTIRYYTSLGLVDPPLDHRGRVAHYGPRHLLQLVAIKLLQEGGLSLADVQRRLTGASDERLRALVGPAAAAAVTAAAVAPPGPTDGTPGRSPNRRRAFWREPPAAPGPVSTLPPPPPPTVRRLIAVELAPGVTLTVETPGADADLDPDVVRRAAEPLLAMLSDLLGQHRHDSSGGAR
jgi:DNA-binding transcriptional MerR regulator